MKEIIQSYRQTREALLRRLEELCRRRGCFEQRITVLEFEIEEIDEVLRTLAKYEEDDGDETELAC